MNFSSYCYILILDLTKSQVIAAEGEQKSSHALKVAADVIAQSPAALQLRYLQVRIMANNTKSNEYDII